MTQHRNRVYDLYVARDKLNEAVEELPYPIVLYPRLCGTFFVFKESPQSEMYLCSCAREAVENYVEMRLLRPVSEYLALEKRYILSSGSFPRLFVEALMKVGISSDQGVLDHLRFEIGLCHECNRVAPRHNPIVPERGVAFGQLWGAYIRKQAYTWGISGWGDIVLRDKCPQELLDLYQITSKDAMTTHFANTVPKGHSCDQQWEQFQRQRMEIRRIVEDEVRVRVGHHKVGEGWISEMTLYHIVKTKFPMLNVQKHFRPESLQGLELDIYVEELKLGIEYQGQQHYKPMKHWGGQPAFEKLVERDKRKKALCAKLGICLVYFRYDEPLTPQHAIDRLEEALQKQS